MKWYLKVLKNYANFSGRARRKEYWYFVLFHWIISMLLAYGMFLAEEMFYVYLAYLLITLLPSIAVTVRRMHDTGKSGWFCLIPIYNLILCCLEGDEFENKYGPDPRREGDELRLA